jgi:putative phosphoribosyl transferase
VPAGHVRLPGDLTVAGERTAVVVFAHGSGSSRLSPRNRWVAGKLQERGLGTLLFDLLTPEEAADRTLVFDIELLARRLSGAVSWLEKHLGPEASFGLFGASTGAGAALWAAAAGIPVRAVVSRGGRPDLAGTRLGSVRVPTLLVVGGADPVVLDLNRRAQARLAGPSELAVIPGAGHLFEESGALERVADLTGDWFERHLSP